MNDTRNPAAGERQLGDDSIPGTHSRDDFLARRLDLDAPTFATTRVVTFQVPPNGCTWA